MGDVVASIRDKRGAVSMLDWVREVGGADTRAIAGRFAMSCEDVRRLMRQHEAAGAVRARLEPFGGSYGGRALVWEII